jgi:hypothetical protein
MGYMKTKQPNKKQNSQEEIDQIVVAQAYDDSAWDVPTHVKQTTSTSLFLPAELAARAAFVARLHRNESVEKWLMHIIRERLEVEEKIYTEVKRELRLKRTKTVK